jgi:predicted GNAT family acetyltransferase
VEPPSGFRVAERADLDLLVQFEELRRVEEDEEEGSDLSCLLAAGLLFVFEEEGRILGFVRSNISDGRRVHAGGLWVHPRWRQGGVGRRLALGIGAHVLAHEGAVVVLDAYRDNPAALRAYAAAGYREVDSGLELCFGPDAWE